MRYVMMVLGMSSMVFAGPAKKKPAVKPPEAKQPVVKPMPPVKSGGEEWSITKDGGIFAYTVDFHMAKDSQDLGRVQRKGLFTPRYSYAIYDAEGNLVAYSLTRFLSPGFFFVGLTDIDVWDADNQYIGGIFGKFWTTSRAKFDFYAGKENHIASAHLHSETTDFVIAANYGKKGMRPIGKISAEGYGDMSEIEVSLKQKFQDDRLLKIFAAFVSDYHDYFIVKPENNTIIIDNSSSN